MPRISRSPLPYQMLFVWLVSIIFLLLFWGVAPSSLKPELGTDYHAFYEPVARNIASGQGIRTDSGAIAATYPPGHPLILASVFYISAMFNYPPSTGLFLLTLLCAGATTVIMYLIAERVWDYPFNLIPPFLSMTYIFTIPIFVNGMEGRLLSEVTFIPLFLASYYLLWKIPDSRCKGARPLVLSLLLGCLLGYLMLIRPIAVGLGAIYLVLLWARMRTFQQASLAPLTLVAFGIMLVVIPWEIWLYRQTGNFILLSTVGLHNARGGLTSFAITTAPYREAAIVPGDVEALMYRLVGRHEEMDSSLAFLNVLRQEFTATPIAMIKLFAIKGSRSWYGTDSGRHEYLTLMVQTIYLMPSLLAMWLAFQQGQNGRHIVGSIGIIVLYFWFMNLMVLPVLRYMVPVMNLLFLLLPALIYPLVQNIRHTDSP